MELENRELIKVKDSSGREFNVYYAHGVWIEEGTHFYYDDDDWAYGVLRRID